MKIFVDFSRSVGKIKPMNAVNNGPVWHPSGDQDIDNVETFREARFPYVRTHDASIDYYYGGEHIVDIIAIFPNFDADVNDPASYDFVMTDQYLHSIEMVGSQVFFRLGNKIEHWTKKYGTLPPKDFFKWAQICEHVIRHYNEGWADGFYKNIVYWEIWNEPNCGNLCWGGTPEEYNELYITAAKHLKGCFPHLKFGGPAFCGYSEEWIVRFFEAIRKANAPLDFLSWHDYVTDPHRIGEQAKLYRGWLDQYGYTEAESICDEWNYCKGFSGEKYLVSVQSIIGIKGAAFSTAVMCMGQYLPLDMLMYYDARPCLLNGLFEYYTQAPLKTWYAYRLWGELLFDLGESIEYTVADADPDIYIAAARGSDGKTVTLLSHFAEDDAAVAKSFDVELKNSGSKQFDIYLLDAEHNMEKTETVLSAEGKLRLTMQPNTVLAIRT